MPEVVVEGEMPEEVRTRIVSGTLKRWRDERIDVLEEKMPAVQAITHFAPLGQAMCKWMDTLGNKGEDGETVDYSSLYELLGRRSAEVATAVADVLEECLHKELSIYADMDHRLFVIRREQVIAVNSKPRLRWHALAMPPQRRTFKVNGEAREAWRLARCAAMEPLKWSCIDGGKVGLKAGHSVPVYIQNHAYQKLGERLVPFCKGRMHDPRFRAAVASVRHGVATSIEEANVGSIDGDDALIEYRFRGCHLGYMAATVVNGAVVIRTFLLVTMSGTPTGDRLRKLLHLNKAEMTWLHLDDFSTVAQSDVRNHERFRRIFREAGCEGILQFGEFHQKDPVAGLTDQLTKYVSSARERVSVRKPRQFRKAS
jgi:hypothetical protein